MWDFNYNNTLTPEQEFIEKGQSEMEYKFGNNTFIWNNITLPCVPSLYSDKISNNEKWFVEHSDLWITVRLSQFPGSVYPQLNDYVYYRGYELKISEIRQFSHNMFFVLVCIKPTA